MPWIQATLANIAFRMHSWLNKNLCVKSKSDLQLCDQNPSSFYRVSNILFRPEQLLPTTLVTNRLELQALYPEENDRAIQKPNKLNGIEIWAVSWLLWKASVSLPHAHWLGRDCPQAYQVYLVNTYGSPSKVLESMLPLHVWKLVWSFWWPLSTSLLLD